MIQFSKTFFIGIMTLAVLLLYTGPTQAFSTENTSLTRSFDKLEVVVGGSIRVTVSFSHLETSSLRGFYYSDHIPQGLTVATERVLINGTQLTNYIYESGPVGEIWAGCITHRWILETPVHFSESNPIPTGETVQIVYNLRSAQSGTFAMNEFSWAGYFQNHSDSAFGHSRSSDIRILKYLDNGGTLPEKGSIPQGVLLLLLDDED